MKIDTSRIDGYAEMTTDEKLAALESYEIEPSGPEIQKWKDAVSRANSEAAEYKKQLRAKQTDDEAKAKEEMMQELETLRKDKAISGYRAKFLELGYDAQSASDAAEALQGGEFDKVFAAQAAFVEAVKKSAVAGALDKQPGLTSGDPVGKETQEQAEVNKLRGYMGLPI